MSRRGLIGLVVIAATVLVSGAWLHAAALSGRMQRLAALEREADGLRTSLAKHDLEERHASLTERLDRSIVPTGDGVADFLRTLSSDLTELDVRDRSLKTGATRRAGLLQRTSVELSFESSLSAVFALLERISHGERIVQLERLVVRRESGSAAEELDVSARLAVFSRNPEEKP